MKKPNKTIISLRIESLLFLFVIAISVALIAASYYLQALFLGVIILILILLGDKPHIGYYLIIFLIPFGSYRGLEAYPFIKIHWLVGLWIVIVLSLKFLIQKEISTNLQSNLWPWFLIFFVICFISTFLSQYGHTSFNTLFLLLVAYMFF